MAKASDNTVASILERAKQIRALAESERALGHETAAENFATILQNLLLKHELDMTDVDAHLDDPIEKDTLLWEDHGLPRSRVRCGWTERLARVVTRAYGCSFFVRTGSNALTLVGKRLNRELCQYTLVVLVRAAREIADHEYQRAFNAAYAKKCPERVRGFRASFLEGFVAGIGERLDEEMTKFKAEEARGEMALVRVSADADEALAWTRRHGVNARASAYGRNDCGDGIERGRERANEIDLTGRSVGLGVAKKLLT